MGQPYVGQVIAVGFNFVPQGWLACDGSAKPISQYDVLFSLLGTTYGGNGQTTFALPNLQGRTPVHVGQGIILGQSAGEAAHTLSIQEMPTHTHTPVANSALANQGSPANNYWSATGSYAPTSNGSMAPAGILPNGGSQPHDNWTPYLVLNFIIALQGIFPSRN